MRVMRYFRELLATLKQIEKHLQKLAGCVQKNYDGMGKPSSMTTRHWNS